MKCSIGGCVVVHLVRASFRNWRVCRFAVGQCVVLQFEGVSFFSWKVCCSSVRACVVFQLEGVSFAVGVCVVFHLEGELCFGRHSRHLSERIATDDSGACGAMTLCDLTLKVFLAPPGHRRGEQVFFLVYYAAKADLPC